MLATLSALNEAVTAMDMSDRAGSCVAAWAQLIGLARIGAIAALAAGLLLLSSAQAKGPVREPDCRMWLAANGPELKDWAVGYLSGMNLVWNAEHKVPAEPLSMLSSREEMFAWLNAYCRANAQQPLGRALIVLFFELVKRKEGR